MPVQHGNKEAVTRFVDSSILDPATSKQGESLAFFVYTDKRSHHKPKNHYLCRDNSKTKRHEKDDNGLLADARFGHDGMWWETFR